MTRLSLAPLLLLVGTLAPPADAGAAISGERSQWHPLTLPLGGPLARERDTEPDPSWDSRLTVRSAHDAVATPRSAREVFTATVVRPANERLPGEVPIDLTVNVDRWSSAEEFDRLIRLLAEGGPVSPGDERRGIGAGSIVPPGDSRWPVWRVDIASSAPHPDGGRLVRLVTAQPLFFAAGWTGSPSVREVAVVELVLDAHGRGEGTLTPWVKLTTDGLGRVACQAPRHAKPPLRLVGVRRWSARVR